MHRRLFLAVAAAVVVAGATGLWLFFAQRSAFYIGPSSTAPVYLEPGDVARIEGPYMEFPGGGGPYLFFKDLHAFPELFHWSTDLAVNWQAWDGPVGHVDAWGQFHAVTPGMIYAKAVPRGSHAFGLAQFIVLPPLDSITLHVSRDTVAVGDTITASYVVVAHGAALPMPTIHRFAMVPDDNTLHSIADSGLHTPVWTQRLRAARRGTVRLEIRLGHHAASHLIVVR